MRDCDRTIEVNSEGHTDYVFQRHSVPKNIAYYRCSDKQCKARLHYNLVTKEISFKNEHLDPSLHKQPRTPCVISVEQSYEDGSRRCISTHAFAARPSDPPSASKQTRSPPTPPPFILKRAVPETLVRVYCESLPAAHDLCRVAVLEYQAVKASCLENAQVYTKENGAEPQCRLAALADLEFSRSGAEAFLAYLRRTCPPDIQISVFKH